MRKWIGRNEISLDTCSSTNDFAMDLARSGCENGTLVQTHQQTAGKGRMGRSWNSFEGSLSFSIVVRPKLDPKKSTRIVFASALAVTLACEKLGVPAFVKWPNDIVVFDGQSRSIEKLGNFRKVAGILVEQIVTNRNIDAAVIGIGINLNRPESDLAALPQAGFLQDYSKSILERKVLLAHLLESLEFCLENMENDESYALLHLKMKERSVFIGKRVVATSENHALRGIVEDITLEGGMLIRKPDGTRHTVFYGDVSLDS